MLCSLIFCSCTSTVYVHRFRDDTQGAGPVRVASVQNARQQELTNFGANLRGKNWRVAVVWFLLHGSRVLFDNDPEGVDGDLSQVGAVL